MRCFDLHCDTAYELFKNPEGANRLSLHISPEKASVFSQYIQIAAIWSEYSLSDEDAWQQYRQIRRCFDRDYPCYTGISLSMPSPTFILSVEDARILHGDLSRLATLHQDGVRTLTLMWKGETCIGGAFDTDLPLTEFGRSVVEECFRLGIVPDVSHASRRVTAEVLCMAQKAGKPVIASHSNAYAVYPHARNLTDDEFRAIAGCGGVVGISLAPQHLTSGKCTAETVCTHIQHYLSLGGENTICLGCDFDGIETTPDDLPDLAALPVLYHTLQKCGVSASIADKIFFENAYGFAIQNFR